MGGACSLPCKQYRQRWAALPIRGAGYVAVAGAHRKPGGLHFGGETLAGKVGIPQVKAADLGFGDDGRLAQGEIVGKVAGTVYFQVCSGAPKSTGGVVFPAAAAGKVAVLPHGEYIQQQFSTGS